MGSRVWSSCPRTKTTYGSIGSTASATHDKLLLHMQQRESNKRLLVIGVAAGIGLNDQAQAQLKAQGIRAFMRIATRRACRLRRGRRSKRNPSDDEDCRYRSTEFGRERRFHSRQDFPGFLVNAARLRQGISRVSVLQVGRLRCLVSLSSLFRRPFREGDLVEINVPRIEVARSR